ncbi:MAG: ATP phosphoribosyltransferase regulatory subunit [Pseudomonadota bacterium]
MNTSWRLPRGVDELLPPRGRRLEQLRRQVLDLFHTWGFDYVEPPVIEYLDALMVGGGEDLDLQTLKVVDQVSGRMLGVRSDMTSQAVRIDAHSLATEDVQRLCYAGPVVFANPRIAQTSRVPIKAGAEIFGAADLHADLEVIRLMLGSVDRAGIDQPVLLLGHMGIYRALVDALVDGGAMPPASEPTLFGLVQRKSQADIQDLLGAGALTEIVARLPAMMGDVDTLDMIESDLAAVPPAARAALDELRRLVDLLAHDQGFDVRIDVAELTGYGYHNGPVFAVYHPEHGRALAQGGRYDGVGRVFGGDGRPATGFDMDLKVLLKAAMPLEPKVWVDFAHRDDPAVHAAVAALRAADRQVAWGLGGAERAPADAQILKQQDGQWIAADQ